MEPAPTLEDLLALAPAARKWVADTNPPAATLALALELGATFLRATEARPPVVIPAMPAMPAPPAPPASKGTQGEGDVYAVIARGRAVRDVTRRAHCGDLWCDTRAGPVLVEVKQYASTVPASEVEKFHRDLGDRDAAAGVFVSLTSPIAGYREAIRVDLEPRVRPGTFMPVVFVSPARGGGRVADEVVAAAVDLAACLAEVYPRGVRGVHGVDALLTYAIATGQVADSVSTIRGDLAAALRRFVADADTLGERLRCIGREARLIATTELSEVEEIKEVTSSEADRFAGELAKRYDDRADRGLLARVVRAAEGASFLGGVIGEEGRWRLLKARAVHLYSGCSLEFAKRGLSVSLPVARVTPEAIATALKLHGKKVRVADGDLAIALDEQTADMIVGLVDLL